MCSCQDVELPDKLRCQADVLLGAAHIKAREPPPDTWLVKRLAVLAAGGSGGAKGKKRVSSCQGGVRSTGPAADNTAETAAGIEAAAAAAGPSDGPPATGTPGAACGAGTSQATAAEEAGEGTEPAAQPQQEQQQSDAGAQFATDAPATASKRKAEAGDEEAECGGGSDAKRCRLGDGQPQRSAQHPVSQPILEQDGQQQQGQQLAPSQAPLLQGSTAPGSEAARAGPAAVSPAVAADAGGNTTAIGDGAVSGDGSSSTVKFSVQPGEVVWVQTKGNPPWPALVITSEEAIDFSVELKQPRIAQVGIAPPGIHMAAASIGPNRCGCRRLGLALLVGHMD